MTKQKISTLDKCIYAFLIIAFIATIIIAILGLRFRYVPNTDSITSRVNLLPIIISSNLSIIASKNDAGKHANLRWFEKIEVKDQNSDWFTPALSYYCTQQDMIDYIDKLHGYITIRFVTRNSQQFNIEKTLKEISFNPSSQCQKSG